MSRAAGLIRPASLFFSLEATMITLPAHRSPLASSRQERGVAPRLRVLLPLLLLLGLVAGCSSAYYNTMEKLGVHKRDIMVDRVGEARDAQEAT